MLKSATHKKERRFLDFLFDFLFYITILQQVRWKANYFMTVHWIMSLR